MKKKKSNKKLGLNKETIADLGHVQTALGDDEKNKIKGGFTTLPFLCCPDIKTAQCN
jgi:hypothetical protein